MPARKSPFVRIALLSTGWFLFLVVAPITSPIPGPGGTAIAALGIILILRNSRWARRQYVVLKARWPRFGGFIDRILMRASAKRRRDRAKAVTAN